MAQWLERGALPLSLPGMWFRITLGAGFSENIMFLPSQSWDIVKMVSDGVSLGKKHFTLKCST